jgi:hypothetical protein
MQAELICRTCGQSVPSEINLHRTRIGALTEYPFGNLPKPIDGQILLDAIGRALHQ